MEEKIEQQKTKPMLIVNTKIVHEVDYGDFDEFVEAVYGIPFECAVDMESGNDSSHAFSIYEKHLWYKWNEEKLSDFEAGKQVTSITRVLLHDLARRGLIAYGNYSIHVSW